MDQNIANTPQPEKKNWVTPDVEVISVLGGLFAGLPETDTLFTGTIS